MISKEKQKFIRALHTKKTRQNENLFLVEGIKSLEELLQSDFSIKFLYITQKFLEKNYDILQNFEYIVCDQKDIEKVSTLPANDWWIAIVEQKLFTLENIDVNKYSLVLDTINDPGNLWTILRIADWYGINQVICNKQTVELYNPKVIISTMWSFTRVKVIVCDLEEFLSQTKLPVYGAFLEWENVHNKQFELSWHIVIWNESHGISAEIEKFVTQKITIPQFWQAESLNAGIATAVILDNVLRNISK